MYENGELDRAMASFEESVKASAIYVGGSMDRADKVEVELPNGRTSNRYRSGNYYNNGKVNELFTMFLHGYAAGKCEERLSA